MKRSEGAAIPYSAFPECLSNAYEHNLLKLIHLLHLKNIKQYFHTISRILSNKSNLFTQPGVAFSIWGLPKDPATSHWNYRLDVWCVFLGSILCAWIGLHVILPLSTLRRPTAIASKESLPRTPLQNELTSGWRFNYGFDYFKRRSYDLGSGQPNARLAISYSFQPLQSNMPDSSFPQHPLSWESRGTY